MLGIALSVPCTNLTQRYFADGAIATENFSGLPKIT